MILGVAAFVYIGSCTLAGTDLAVGVSLGFRAGMVFVSARAGSDVFVIGLGGSAGSFIKI